MLVALLACLAWMALRRYSTLSLLVGVVVTLVAVGLDRYYWRGKQTA
jgi:multisubunit Na+/H+ antiporter MnhE subunit